MTETSRGTVLGHVRTLLAASAADRLPDWELLQAFAERQDQAAFAVLVRRHGPMVLNVCRRVLRHQQDAEDAFQATFLILARKGASLRRPRTLAGWLYGAAYRMALSVRRAAARRRYHEGKAPAMPQTTHASDLDWRELQVLLEEEMQQLPEAYRMTFVLCCMESKSRAEAARILGVKEGTISSRLDQARKRLQRRLARRGVSLSAVLAAVALIDPIKAAVLPSALFAATARAAVAGVISDSVTALVERGTKALFASKLPMAPLLLVVSMAMAGAGSIAGAFSGEKPVEEKPARPSNSGAAIRSQPPRTDFNGEPLPDEASARLGTLRFRPGGFVSTLRFAPDGKTLVAGTTNGTLCLFDAVTGRDVRRSRLGGPTLRPGAISSDGKWVVIDPGRKNGAIDAEAAIELRECATGKKLREFGKAPYVSGLFSPDGKTLAGLRYDRIVEIWDLPTGRLLRSWKTSDEPGYDLNLKARFTAGGNILVTSHGNVVRSWEVASGTKVREFHDILTNTLFAVSPQGVLAVDGTDYTPAKNIGGEFTEARARLFDAVTGKELRQLVVRQKKNALGKPWWFLSNEFSPDGTLLATGGQDGLIRLWDVATGKELRTWPYGPNHPGALCFSPDSQKLAICDAGQTIRVLDVATGAERTSPAGHRSGFYRPAFAPDGKTVLTLSAVDPVMHIWDANTGRLRRRQEWPRAQMAASALSRDGGKIFSWANDRIVRTWDVATGKELGHWRDNVGSPYFGGIVPSADGNILALWFQGPTIYLLDAATGKELRRLETHAPYPSGAVFLPDGRSLVTWGGDARARVWDVATGRERRQMVFTDVPDPRRPVAPVPVAPGSSFVIFSTVVSPDGNLLAFGSRNGFIEIHDLASGKIVRRIDRLPNGVSEMAFSPDSRTLAWSGDEDSVVRFLEIASGRERHHLSGHLGRISSLLFSPDGRRLVSASADTTALVWDLAAVLAAGSPKDRETAWADLASDDAARAYRAIRRLAASPTFLHDRLEPIPAADEMQVARLIGELDRDDFSARQKATMELERLGEAAVLACRKALNERPSAEARRRLEALLDKQVQAAWKIAPERLRAGRALEALELSGTPAARRVLEKVARGPAGARLTEEARAALRRPALLLVEKK